jgi:hypothetical protein
MPQNLEQMIAELAETMSNQEHSSERGGSPAGLGSSNGYGS